MNLSGFDRSVWAASFCGHIALVLVLWTKHRARPFPAFTTLIVENVARAILLYFVFYHLSHRVYFYSYWSMSIVDQALQFLVFLELGAKIFCPLGVWASDVRRTFAALVCASTLLASLLTWLAHPVGDSLVQTFILRSGFLGAALMSELFVGMLVLSSTSGLPMKTYVARIAQGLGVYSIACVAKGIILNYVGWNQHETLYRELTHARIAAYLVCEAYWIVTLWQEAPAPRELPETMQVQIFGLQRQIEYDLMLIRSWRRN